MLLPWLIFQIREYGKEFINTIPLQQKVLTLLGLGAVLPRALDSPKAYVLVILWLLFFNLPTILARYR